MLYGIRPLLDGPLMIWQEHYQIYYIRYHLTNCKQKNSQVWSEIILMYTIQLYIQKQPNIITITHSYYEPGIET